MNKKIRSLIIVGVLLGAFGILRSQNAVVRSATTLSIANIQAGGYPLCAPASASGTTYTCAMSPTLTAYTSGMIVTFKPDVANTGAATVNIDTLGAKSIVADNTTGSALVVNDLLAGTGQVYTLLYDGTSFRILNGPDGAWTAFAYSNSWADFGSSRQVGQYRKLHNGDVQYRGTLAAGTLTIGTTVLTFPSGYRPATLQTTVAQGAVAAGKGPGGGNNGYNNAQLDITTAGLLVQQTDATLYNAGGAWVVNGVFSVY